MLLLAAGALASTSAVVNAAPSEYPGDPYGVATMSLATDTDGDHLIGAIGSLSGETDFAVARFNSSGRLDKRFAHNGFAKPFTDRRPDRQAQAKNVAVAPDGKIAVVGFRKSTINAGGRQRLRAPAIAMLRPSGRPVKRFGEKGTLTWGYYEGNGTFLDAVFQSSRRLIVVGAKNPALFKGQAATVTAFKPNGEFDRGFGSGGHFAINPKGSESTEGSDLTNFESVELLPNGKLIVSGYISGRPAVVRLTRNGRLDRPFGHRGIVKTRYQVDCDICGEDILTDVAVGADGSIYLKNELTLGLSVQKFSADGDVVKSYGRRGIVRTEPSQAQPALNEFVDPTFKPARAFSFGGLVVSKDGRVTVATTAIGLDGTKERDEYFRSVVIGYDREGRLDRSFGKGGFMVREPGTAGATGQPVNFRGKVWTGGVINLDGKDHLDLWSVRR